MINGESLVSAPLRNVLLPCSNRLTFVCEICYPGPEPFDEVVE
jgi:hypothetical protein